MLKENQPGIQIALKAKIQLGLIGYVAFKKLIRIQLNLNLLLIQISIMENTIDTIFSNPVYIAIAGVLAIILVYAIIKKIIKLVFTIGVLLVLYAVYLNYTDQEVPQNLEEFKESVSESVEKAKNVASESLEDVKESTKNIVEEKVEKKVNEVFGDQLLPRMI